MWFALRKGMIELGYSKTVTVTVKFFKGSRQYSAHTITYVHVRTCM